jgi:hypothetical protein
MTLGFELVKGVLVPVIADAVGVVAHELMDVVKLSGFERVGRSDAFAQHVDECIEGREVIHDAEPSATRKLRVENGRQIAAPNTQPAVPIQCPNA